MGNETTVKLVDINCQTVRVAIVGISPLLQNRFTEETQKTIEEKQAGKGRQERKPKDPPKDAEAKLYELEPPRDDCKYGHPAVAFKNAIVRATKLVVGRDMTDMRNLLFVTGGDDGLVPIVGADEWVLDSRRVVLSKKTLDIAHRPRTPTGWKADLDIEYNASGITAEEIVNLLQLAGFGVGIGDYRPECDGPYGRFKVVEG